MILLISRYKYIEIPVVVVVSGIGAHPGLDPACAAISHTGPERDLRERPLSVILIKEFRYGIIGYVKIQIPIVVEVGKGQSHALPGKIMDPDDLRHICEGPIPVVVIEHIRLGVVHPGMTVEHQVAQPKRALYIVSDCEIHVVNHVKV